MVDGGGVPLSCLVSAANVPDVKRLVATVVAVPDPRLPGRLLGDRAYDSEKHEGLLRWMGVEPASAGSRGVGPGSFQGFAPQPKPAACWGVSEG